MSGDRLTRVWMFTAVIISLVTFSVADNDYPVLLIGVPVSVLAWFITTGPSPRMLPRYAINILLFFVVAWTSLTVFSRGLGVSLFSEFVAALMVIKLFDRRSSRDNAQVLTLSVFLMIGAVLTSNTLWVGALLLLFIPVIVSAVLWHQLARVAERELDARGIRVRPALGPMRRRGLVMTAASVTIAVVVFVLMPREIGSDSFGSWGTASVGRVVGFNDEVKLGTGGLISESQSPVLDLEVYDREGNSIGAFGRRFYLRGAVLDTYDTETGSWIRSNNPLNAFQPGPGPMMRSGMTAVGGDRPAAWTVRLEVTIRNMAEENGHLFSIWRPYQIRVHPPGRLGFSVWDGALRVENTGGKVSYTVHCNDREQPPITWDEYTPDQRRAVLIDLPGVAEVTRGLLRDAGIEPDPLKRPASDDLQAVSILRNHFDTGGFRYTLDTIAAPAGRDPIEWFLRDGREGHCEYYASSLAAMCRTVGINARVITGYVATDYNTTTASYIVRASNAHAWVEAEVLPGYWRTFDPTPTADQTRIHEPPRGLLADIRRVFDTVEFAWIRSVVSYDAEARSRIFGPGDAEVSLFPILERVMDFADTARNSPERLILRAARNALVVSAVVMVVGLSSLRWGGLVRRWLGRRLRLGLGRFIPSFGREALQPAQALHAEFLDLLRSAGVEKPGWLPLRVHMRDLGRSGVFGERVERAATRVCDLLYAALFSDHRIGDDQYRSARDDLAVIREWAGQRRGRRRRPKTEPATD